MIKLSKRLEMVASLVDINSNCADIGADHGYLISYLYSNKIINKGYACENKEGPFLRLKENINNLKLNNVIDIQLSDGISNLPNYINCVIIAGMGGDTVCKIISDSKTKLSKIDCFIISSHTKMYEVRKYLINEGYYICDEKSCFDEDQYYVVSKFYRGENTYSDIYLKYGPKLIENKDLNLLAELKLQKAYNLNIVSLKNIPESKKEKLYRENIEINKIIDLLK